MHAFLVISNNQKQTDEEIKKIIKVHEIKNNIPFSLKKIEDSKELKKIIKYSFSKKTAIILNDFDNATPEAVNSVLKNIEEPNQNLFYILTADMKNKIELGFWGFGKGNY
jgi:translation initiation factor 2 alpha subunit (eIF-2alpha)